MSADVVCVVGFAHCEGCYIGRGRLVCTEGCDIGKVFGGGGKLCRMSE